MLVNSNAVNRSLNAENAKLAGLFYCIFLGVLCVFSVTFAVKIFPNINNIFCTKNEDLTCNTILIYHNN